MAKKAYAVTNIKHGNGFIEAGEEVDLSQFDRKQLQELYDDGAIEARDTDDPRNKEVDDETNIRLDSDGLPEASEIAKDASESDRGTDKNDNDDNDTDNKNDKSDKTTDNKTGEASRPIKASTPATTAKNTK